MDHVRNFCIVAHIVPVINEIDLPSAEVERVMEEIDRDLGLDPFASIQVSTKQ